MWGVLAVLPRLGSTAVPMPKTGWCEAIAQKCGQRCCIRHCMVLALLPSVTEAAWAMVGRARMIGIAGRQGDHPGRREGQEEAQPAPADVAQQQQRAEEGEAGHRGHLAAARAAEEEGAQENHQRSRRRRRAASGRAASAPRRRPEWSG